MARYSDADKMKNAVMEYVNEYGEITEMFITDFNIMLERCSADVRENVKGKWRIIEEPDGYYHTECDICGQNLEEDVFMRKKKYNFCPNCGADMRDNYENI